MSLRLPSVFHKPVREVALTVMQQTKHLTEVRVTTVRAWLSDDWPVRGFP